MATNKKSPWAGGWRPQPQPQSRLKDAPLSPEEVEVIIRYVANEVIEVILGHVENHGDAVGAAIAMDVVDHVTYLVVQALTSLLWREGDMESKVDVALTILAKHTLHVTAMMKKDLKK